MRCSALDCLNNEDGYCTCENYIEITKDGNCDSYEVRKDIPVEYVVIEDNSDDIKTFLINGKKNPCGCGSNCFHYRRKDGVIRAYCNSCGAALYEIKKEYYNEFVKENRWKKRQYRP